MALFLCPWRAEGLDAIMTDTTETTAAATGATASETAASQVNVTPAETIDSLPEFAQTIISDLRRENGDHRVKNRDLQTISEQQEKQIADLTQAKTDLETTATEAQATVTLTDQRVQELETQLETEKFGRFKDREALTRGVPLKIAEKLSAETREEFTQLLETYLEDIEEKTKAKGIRFDPAQVATPKTTGSREEAINSFFNSLD